MTGLADDVRRASDRASVLIDREESRARLRDTEQTFLLRGWIPAERWEDTERKLSAYPCAWQVEDPAEEEYPQVPVSYTHLDVYKRQHLAYVMAGIASLPSITPYHLKLEYDGQTIEDDFFYGMVCNTYSVGGIKNLPTDRVDLDDGLFEVILVRKPMNIFDIGAGLQALLRPGAVEELSLIHI